MATKTKSATAITLYTNQKSINAAIKAAGIVGHNYQKEMHVIACSVLARIGKHKDMRTLQTFLENVPDMVRVNSLKLWFETFTQVTFTNAEGKALDMPAYVSTKKHRLGDAMEKPFWSFKAKEGEVYQALDFDKFAEQTIKKLKKDAEQTGRDYSGILTVLKTFKPVEKAKVEQDA